MSKQRSIVIGGGAFAGLGLALALRQGLGADVPIVVADPAFVNRPSGDPRASAIVAACRRLFETLGAWDAVAADYLTGRCDAATARQRSDATTRPASIHYWIGLQALAEHRFTEAGSALTAAASADAQWNTTRTAKAILAWLTARTPAQLDALPRSKSTPPRAAKPVLAPPALRTPNDF